MREPLQNISSIPKNVTAYQKINKNFLGNSRNEKGVKGMLPLGCLPLWGSEGVILILSGKNPSHNQKKIR